MKNTAKKAVIITGPGFEDPEVLVPLLYLPAEGIAVDVVTVGKSPDVEVKGKHGYSLAPTARVADLSVDSYDAVLITGGYEAPDRVRQNNDVVVFVRGMFKAGKIVSSICHGPWVLCTAEVLKGKKATCYPGMKDDLIHAGAEYISEPVVIDGNLITSDRPQNSGFWTKETIEAIKNQE